jgi:hypothetical protein
MTDSNDRILGQVEGKLTALIQNVETQREESSKSRAGIYRKLESIERSIEKIDGRVTSTESKQVRADETMRFVETIKQRAIGIAFAVSFAFTMLGAGFVLGIQKLAKWMGVS